MKCTQCNSGYGAPVWKRKVSFVKRKPSYRFRPNWFPNYYSRRVRRRHGRSLSSRLPSFTTQSSQWNAFAKRSLWNALTAQQQRNMLLGIPISPLRRTAAMSSMSASRSNTPMTTSRSNSPMVRSLLRNPMVPTPDQQMRLVQRSPIGSGSPRMHKVPREEVTPAAIARMKDMRAEQKPKGNKAARVVRDSHIVNLVDRLNESFVSSTQPTTPGIRRGSRVSEATAARLDSYSKKES